MFCLLLHPNVVHYIEFSLFIEFLLELGVNVSQFVSDVVWVLEEVELFIDRDLDYFAVAHIFTLKIKSEVFISILDYL